MPPPLKPKGPVNAKFSLALKELPIQIRMQDAAWLLGRNVTRIQADSFQAIEAIEQLDQSIEDDHQHPSLVSL